MLRAVAAVVLAGLVAWAVFVQLGADDKERAPAAAPLTPRATAVSTPPPWVRYPSPLEGSWTADSGRLRLVVDNARLTLTDVTHYRWLRFIRVEGHRLHVTPATGEGELATYRWRIRGDRLTFRLLERTPDAALRLEELTFHRARSGQAES